MAQQCHESASKRPANGTFTPVFGALSALIETTSGRSRRLAPVSAGARRHGMRKASPDQGLTLGVKGDGRGFRGGNHPFESGTRLYPRYLFHCPQVWRPRRFSITSLCCLRWESRTPDTPNVPRSPARPIGARGLGASRRTAMSLPGWLCIYKLGVIYISTSAPNPHEQRSKRTLCLTNKRRRRKVVSRGDDFSRSPVSACIGLPARRQPSR
jgi:hypothetical protein